LTAWITNTLVRKYALVLWSSLNYTTNSPFTSEANFGSFIDTYLIPGAQDHINSYCNRDFDVDYPSTIPDAIKDICARAASNMVQYLVMNRTGPLIRISDYRISMPEQDVLPDDLKKLLEPWVAASTVYVKATSYQTGTLADRWDE
jgi:hypothetical protein